MTDEEALKAIARWVYGPEDSNRVRREVTKVLEERLGPFDRGALFNPPS